MVTPRLLLADASIVDLKRVERFLIRGWPGMCPYGLQSLIDIGRCSCLCISNEVLLLEGVVELQGLLVLSGLVSIGVRKLIVLLLKRGLVDRKTYEVSNVIELNQLAYVKSWFEDSRFPNWLR